jgi:hypothetical protein
MTIFMNTVFLGKLRNAYIARVEGYNYVCTPLCTPNLMYIMIYSILIKEERICVAFNSSSARECA